MRRWKPAVGEDVLGPLEREVMRALWEADEPLRVRDVLDLLNGARTEPLAYTTVMTTLARLTDKGMLRRHQRGRGYLYEAEVTDPAAVAVRSVVREFGDAALAHLIEEARGDPALRTRLVRLMEDER